MFDKPTGIIITKYWKYLKILLINSIILVYIIEKGGDIFNIS